MPGPGGGGWGGGERGGPGGGGPGGGGFRGPGAPANPGLFFGGPGLGPEFGRHGGGRPGGPMGTSCCCWALLCTIAFVVLLSAGVALIETADECSGDSSSIGRDDDGTVCARQYDKTAVHNYDIAVSFHFFFLLLLLRKKFHLLCTQCDILEPQSVF